MGTPPGQNLNTQEASRASVDTRLRGVLLGLLGVNSF